ncbi:MAG: hypothetical protein HGA82_01340 [Anaerolineales bacterium]|nr:hypothetical protein [Anaerolineales bacterium]
MLDPVRGDADVQGDASYAPLAAVPPPHGQLIITDRQGRNAILKFAAEGNGAVAPARYLELFRAHTVDEIADWRGKDISLDAPEAVVPRAQIVQGCRAEGRDRDLSRACFDPGTSSWAVHLEHDRRLVRKIAVKVSEIWPDGDDRRISIGDLRGPDIELPGRGRIPGIEVGIRMLGVSVPTAEKC